ncbi:MAG: insulinase family protein [Methylohalobius sp.]|nr:insulinase family protein [Methylohalobius sp.]
MSAKHALLCFLWLMGSMALAGPKIEHWPTSKGAKVYYVYSPELPMVDVRVTLAAGSAFDGEKSGLATLTSMLLDKGAGEWDADAIARRLEDVGARLETGTARDSSWLHLRSLTDPDKLEQALITVGQILASPRFAEEDFVREKQRLLLALQRQEESPDQIAQKLFFKAIYGRHPYAQPIEGEIEAVKTITREDLVDFHRRFYVARNSWIVIVGALERGRAAQVAERLTADLAEGESAPPLPDVQEGEDNQVVRRSFPSAQTHVLTGMPALARGDPEYFPLYVGNHVLGGGGFTSRLVQEVREKRGLSYSVASYFLPLKQEGPFLASLQTRNDQAEAALEVLNRVIRAYLDEGPSDKELTAAKKNLTGGFVLNYDSNAKLADYLATIAFYDLPLDWLDAFPKRVEAVTRQQVIRAFRRLNPDRFRTVLVGGSSKADEQK